MSGIDDGGFGKGENFFSDSIQQDFTASTGKIPSSNPVCKKDVPAKKLSATRKIEAEAARAVAWHVEQLGVGPFRWGRGGFFKKLGRVDGAKLFGKTKGKHGIRLKAEKSGVGMVVDRATGPFGKIGGIPDVIPVTMG